MLPVAFADQYRSEQRIGETPQQANKPEDPQQLLRTTTDPYGKALLLRDLAAQAVQKHEYGKARQYLEQALAQNALSGPAAAQMKNDLAQLYMASGDLKKMQPRLEAQVKNGQASTQVPAAPAPGQEREERGQGKGGSVRGD